jgi:hypothetical protein
MVYWRKSFQEPKFSGASVTPHSRISTSAILLKSFIRNGKLWYLGVLEWYEFHRIFLEIKLDGPEGENGMRAPSITHKHTLLILQT